MFLGGFRVFLGGFGVFPGGFGVFPSGFGAFPGGFAVFLGGFGVFLCGFRVFQGFQGILLWPSKILPQWTSHITLAKLNLGKTFLHSSITAML